MGKTEVTFPKGVAIGTSYSHPRKTSIARTVIANETPLGVEIPHASEGAVLARLCDWLLAHHITSFSMESTSNYWLTFPSASVAATRRMKDEFTAEVQRSPRGAEDT